MKNQKYIEEINELFKTHGDALPRFYEETLGRGFCLGVQSTAFVILAGGLAIKAGKELYESHKRNKES